MTLFLMKGLHFRTKNSFMSHFVKHFVLSRASHNTTSPNIGGTDAWAAPHLKFGGTVHPVPSKSPPMGATAIMAKILEITGHRAYIHSMSVYTLCPIKKHTKIFFQTSS